MNGDEGPNNELYESACVKGVRDPFVLPRYRVSPVAVRVSADIQIGEGLLNLWVRTVWAEAVINV